MRFFILLNCPRSFHFSKVLAIGEGDFTSLPAMLYYIMWNLFTVDSLQFLMMAQ